MVNGPAGCDFAIAFAGKVPQICVHSCRIHGPLRQAIQLLITTVECRAMADRKTNSWTRAAALAGAFLFSGAALAANPEGTWVSEDGAAKVQIFNCGGKLCGTVVWLKNPTDPATGAPKTDKKNPDAAKKGRPLIGLTVLYGMTQHGPDSWTGQIYNADDGRTYAARLHMPSPSYARVEGCVLIFCKRHIWTRTDGGVQHAQARAN
jgi:uncharacterized protein (DUF2147 family)